MHLVIASPILALIRIISSLRPSAGQTLKLMKPRLELVSLMTVVKHVSPMAPQLPSQLRHGVTPISRLMILITHLLSKETRVSLLLKLLVVLVGVIYYPTVQFGNTLMQLSPILEFSVSLVVLSCAFTDSSY